MGLPETPDIPGVEWQGRFIRIMTDTEEQARNAIPEAQKQLPNMMASALFAFALNGTIQKYMGVHSSEFIITDPEEIEIEGQPSQWQIYIGWRVAFVRTLNRRMRDEIRVTGNRIGKHLG